MPDREMPMMKCGHAANAINSDTQAAVCVICIGIDLGATIIDDNPPDLSQRIARCSYGAHKDVPSHTGLAFFEHRPDAQFDSYYCGCHGWD